MEHCFDQGVGAEIKRLREEREWSMAKLAVEADMSVSGVSMIENGKRTHMLRDVIYHGITPEFWNSCDGVADRRHSRRFGFITCGKGQPGQHGHVSHGAAPARFRNVRVGVRS